MNKLFFVKSFLIFALLQFVIASQVMAAETTMEQPLGQSGKAIIVFASSPLKAMTETPFAISLLDGNGQVITNAALSINMDMPAMPMPPNNPVVTWDNGAYRGKAIFTMAGAWQVKVDIQVPGLDQQHVVFEIEQVMM